MEERTRYLLQRLCDAGGRGAAIYKDGKKLSGIPEFGSLMEDSSYMMDVEDDDCGEIIRINFQKLNKEII